MLSLYPALIIISLCVPMASNLSVTVDNVIADKSIVTEEKISQNANQSFTSISESDKELLAHIARTEAGNQSAECEQAVISSVLNRVNSDKFPNTVYDVLYQQKQFTSVTSVNWAKYPPREQEYEAVEYVLQHGDTCSGALYFESCSGSSWHSKHLQLICQIGEMRFYK